MTLTQARKYLKRAEKSGYVAYHSGIASMSDNGRKQFYGINIDGDGQEGRLFGRPKLIWDADQAEERFPSRRSKHKGA